MLEKYSNPSGVGSFSKKGGGAAIFFFMFTNEAIEGRGLKIFLRFQSLELWISKKFNVMKILNIDAFYQT